MNMECILVVDDAPGTLEIIRRNLTSKGYRVFTAGNVAEAVSILDTTIMDLVVTDLKMPGADGFDLLRHVRENFKDIEVVMITGFPSIEGAVRAVKIGAEEYLPKPFTDEELFSTVTHALQKLRERRNARNKTTPFDHYGIIGESKAMRSVFRFIRRASETSATVLICGESGTWKEVVARAIHYNGKRAAAPFVPVNCGAIPENLLESELFGYVKGAFTGAVESRAGFFQISDKGTIFLDEISEASLPMQVKLLRVLQDKEIFMLGSSRLAKVDVRVMAATNRNLTELVKKRAFREDLFYRLNVVTIDIPPLRQRREDIAPLAHHMIGKFAKEFDKEPPHISDEAFKALETYQWPGNVRELENIIQRLVVMTEGHKIEVSDLPSLMRFSAPNCSSLDRSLKEVETGYIRNVLESVDGNKTQAARILGIDRKTLREKLKSSETGAA